MSLLDAAQSLFIVVPIATLLFVGALIALRSGLTNFDHPRSWRGLVTNFWSMAARLVAYLLGLLALQELVGFRLDW